MQLSKNIKLVVAGIAASCALSTSVQAATASYSVGFTTVPDVSIIQLTAMDFGVGLQLTAGGTCIMKNVATVADVAYVGNGILRLAPGTGVLAAGTDNADLSGACPSGKGTIGVYEVTGAPGAEVQVKVNALTTGTNFNFTPVGCISDYNNAADGDLCAAINPNTNVPVNTAATDDVIGNATGSGAPASGKTFIAVGGSLTVAQTLTAGTTYTEQFTIDVTY
jgi:hypothetical protein